MAASENEFVTVSLRNTVHRGVHYATDPESGWVSVLVPGAPPRLLLVRPELVSCTGQICTTPPVLRSSHRASNLTVDTVPNGPAVDEIIAALRRRGMEAQIEGESVQLLDRTVKINPPFGASDVRSQNETILARIASLLHEIREEIAAQHQSAVSGAEDSINDEAVR